MKGSCECCVEVFVCGVGVGECVYVFRTVTHLSTWPFCRLQNGGPDNRGSEGHLP